MKNNRKKDRILNFGRVEGAGDTNLDNAYIPTESFVTANSQIFATVKTGQLTMDRNFGIEGFHWPGKRSPSIIKSFRIKLMLDGHVFHECYDHADKSVVIKRGYLKGTNIIFWEWEADGIVVTEHAFIPEDSCAVIQATNIRNGSDRPREIKAFGIIQPQAKVIMEAKYMQEDGIILITHSKGNNIVVSHPFGH